MCGYDSRGESLYTTAGEMMVKQGGTYKAAKFNLEQMVKRVISNATDNLSSSSSTPKKAITEEVAMMKEMMALMKEVCFCSICYTKLYFRDLCKLSWR